jgi:hypothetical protein
MDDLLQGRAKRSRIDPYQGGRLASDEGRPAMRRLVVRHVTAWLVAGLAGSLVFWLVQVLTGGPTITEFMGDQIVSIGGYPKSLAVLVGWAVHLAVSLSYAFLFAVIGAGLGHGRHRPTCDQRDDQYPERSGLAGGALSAQSRAGSAAPESSPVFPAELGRPGARLAADVQAWGGAIAVFCS